MKWDYKKIGDLCNVCSSSRVFAKQYANEGIPFYRQKEIIDKKNGNIIDNPIFISESVYNEFQKKSGAPTEGDLLVTAVGATLGIAYVVGNEKFYFKDGNLIWLNKFNNDLNSEFLYYWIDSTFGTQSLWNRTIGSAQPALTIDSIKNLSIPIPSRDIQDKIATILKTYDLIIHNNNKRIKLLEQMADSLYKEWFVRFRFPGYKTIEFKEKKPINWKESRLGEFGINLESGSRPKGGIDSTIEDGVPSLGAESIMGLAEFDYSDIKMIPHDFYNGLKRGKNKGNHILVYKDGAYIGKVTLFKYGFPFETYAINEHVFFMNAIQDEYQNYLYFTLKQPAYFTTMQNLNRNAAQPGLSQPDINRIKILVPDKITVEKFNNYVEPILKEVFQLAKQNLVLIKQRDYLLPRLMSGKLEV